MLKRLKRADSKGGVIGTVYCRQVSFNASVEEVSPWAVSIIDSCARAQDQAVHDLEMNHMLESLASKLASRTTLPDDGSTVIMGIAERTGDICTSSG